MARRVERVWSRNAQVETTPAEKRRRWAGEGSSVINGNQPPTHSNNLPSPRGQQQQQPQQRSLGNEQKKKRRQRQQQKRLQIGKRNVFASRPTTGLILFFVSSFPNGSFIGTQERPFWFEIPSSNSACNRWNKICWGIRWAATKSSTIEKNKRLGKPIEIVQVWAYEKTMTINPIIRKK